MSDRQGGGLGARTARNTAVVATARVLSKLLVLYVFLLIVRSMSKDNYGRFSLLIVFSALTSMIVDIGLRPLFTREVAKDRTRLTSYLNSILSLKLVMAVPALLVLFVAIRVQLPDAIYTVLPTLALLMSTSFANQMRAAFYAMGRLGYEAVAIAGEAVILLGGTIMVATLHLPWWYFIWAYTASYLFVVVYAATVAVTRFGHRFKFDLNFVRLGALARESIPFALTFVITTLYYRVDQPILRAFTTLAVVGLYGAAYKFLDAVVFIPQTLMDPVYPALAELSTKGGGRLESATVKAYKMLAVAALPATIGMVVFAQPIVLLGAGSEYRDAVPILQVLALGVPFLFLNNTFIYTLNAMGRQIESTRLAVVSLVLNVALNLVLIPQASAFYGGARGAAWATALTELGLFIGGWYLLRRHLFAVPVLRSLRGILPSGLIAAAVTFGTVALLGARFGEHLVIYVIALVLGSAAYLVALLATRAFTEDELATVMEAARSLVRR